MSEYISICPSCRQRILCDTQYTGQRVACPLCLQEITMPAPPAAAQPAAIPASPTAGRPATPAKTATAGAKRGIPVPVVATAAVVLVSAGVGAWFFLSEPKAVAPAPVAATPAPVAPTPTVAAPVTIVAAHKPQASAEDCRAVWNFDLNSGNTVVDATGNGNNARLEGAHAICVQDPARGSVLAISNSSYAQTTGPIVDTTQSFTVAAWVNLTKIGSWQTIVSMDGTQVSAFYLQFNHIEGDRFAFNRLESDDASARPVLAKSSFVPVAHTWYHLAGVYDAKAKTISLYVNGDWQSTVPFPKPWQATGKTAIGRGFYQHDNRDFVNGAVAAVRIYATALSTTQIRALAAE